MPRKKSSALKGAIFEWFIRNLLLNCGFNQVTADGNLIFLGSPGLMIHGLGQPHNADVLMEPPFQIPFYFPSRLLVECKCYSEEAKLPMVRNILGLREDINNFEIVTPDILKARRNYRRTTIAAYSFDRYLYQVALASLAGFNFPAQEFATTHRIPLIPITKIPQYQILLSFINTITDEFCDSLGSRYTDCLLFFKKDSRFSNSVNLPHEINSFVDNSSNLFKSFFVGVLQNGDILLLYCTNKNEFQNRYLNSTIEIHYFEEKQYWSINEKDKLDGWQLIFELPDKIYNEWADADFSKYVAIDMKEKKFKEIYLFGKINGVSQFITLKLDDEFIKKARKKLTEFGHGPENASP